MRGLVESLGERMELMATLDTLVTDGIRSPRRTAHAGSNGAWRVTVIDRTDGTFLVDLWHYAHRMAAFVADGDGDLVREHGIYLCTGWGSVSDQNGMNRILSAANAQIRFRRDELGGGPRYVSEEWDELADYGHGWEVVCTEETRSEAISRLREYRENDPYATRLRVREGNGSRVPRMVRDRFGFPVAVDVANGETAKLSGIVADLVRYN